MNYNFNYYQEMDKKGFETLQILNDEKKFFTKLIYTPLYCKHDAYAEDIFGNQYAIEIKLHDFPSTTYSEAIIDTSKLNYLQSLIPLSLIPLYINFYSDKVVYIHRLFPETSGVSTRMMTIWNRGLSDYQTKSVSFIPLNQSILQLQCA